MGNSDGGAAERARLEAEARELALWVLREEQLIAAGELEPVLNIEDEGDADGYDPDRHPRNGYDKRFIAEAQALGFNL